MGVEPVWGEAPDETLLERARREPGAFGAFYRRHEDRMLSYFLARVGDPEVAADLTAETFAAALVSAHRFRPRREPAAAWLFGIARNTLAMSRRRGRVEARARRRLGMAPLVLTDELVERISELDDDRVLELVSDLPAEQQQAVRARVIDERDYADIAKDMRCSEAVVRKRGESRARHAEIPAGGAVTRLPQLEQELVAAAARLQSPRRLLAPAARVALAVGAVAVAAVIALAIPAGEGGSPRPQPAAAPAFPPNAKLQDMLGVFRLPATPADDLGFKGDDLDELPDRQPGEDPTRGRRVEWPGASISLWPMQDGVCYSVSNGGGCLPLDHLRRVGVSVGTQSGRQGSSVSGVVVDGIREVVLTASAGPDLHVPVSENFFFVDLTSAAAKLEAPGWETRVQAVRWHYSGEERSFTVGRLLHDDGVTPVPSPPGITDGEPVHGRRLPDLAVHGLRGTDQGRRRHAALNRLPRRAATARRAGAAASPPLRRRGRRPRRLRAPGFARAKAVKLSPAYRTSDLTVILSKPWRPEPWKGEPIRFFFVFAPDENAQGVPPPHLPLDVRLSDGRTVRVP